MSIADKLKGAVQGAVKTVVEHAPDSMIPGATPDPLIRRKHGLIGTSVSRIDGPQKVRGAAQFAAEFPLDGMVYAAFVYSTIARGRIMSIDTAKAEGAPGVVLVMTHENCPRLKPTPMFGSNEKAAGGDDLPTMQDAEIHWNGQPIAMVLAETQEQADYAKSLVYTRYEIAEAATVFDVAKVSTRQGVFQGEPLLLEIGEAEKALEAAPLKVDHVYTTPRHNHNPIELHAATVKWDGDRLLVHDATQAVSHTAWSLAQVFGIDEDRVHVTSPYVGGGFGSKTLWRHQVLAAAASKLSKRPVRAMLSREGVYRIVGGRTLTEQRVAIGAQPDGHINTLIHAGVVAMTKHNVMPEPFILPAKSAYAADSFRLDVQVADMDMLANTFMRAPGESVGTFGLECAMDELAVELGLDPIELRLKNEPEKDPTTGTPFSSRNIIEAYHAGAERFGWKDRSATPGSRRQGEWLVGMGCATGTYPYYRMPGGKARLTLALDGRVEVEIAAHEMGMGTATAHSMVVADRLGVGLECVGFGYGDSAMPGVVLAGGSQQTASIEAAVMTAEKELFKELLGMVRKGSPLEGLKSDEVEGRDGGLVATANSKRRESYASILRNAGKDEVSVEGTAPPPLEIMHWSMHSFSAIFCEVWVNAVTGEIRVKRLLGSFDVGTILNAKTAASQLRGGMIMGLGLALMEETQVDERKGRIMNPSLAEYHVPVHMDVPEIDVIWTDIPDPRAPMGAHGVGEIGITGVGAAVANAVYNATGKRVRELPITLDKLM